jgi:preprotein translocase subunit SecA
LINTVLGKVFGTRNDREIKRLRPRVAAINALESEVQKLSDDQLRAKTDEFRKIASAAFPTSPTPTPNA